MESIINTSPAVLGFTRNKRVASPAPFLHQPTPQQTKHQRISHQTQRTRSVPLTSPRSITWYDFRDQVAENAGDAREPERNTISSSLTTNNKALQEQVSACISPKNSEIGSLTGSAEIIGGNRDVTNLQ
jgi:hypothetical protein